METTTSTVKTPDGKSITFTHPDNATSDQILAFAKSAYNAQQGIVFDKGGVKISGTEGEYSLSSEGYSTNDQEKINKVLEDYKDVPAADVTENIGGDMSKSSYYQDVLKQRPYSSFASQMLNTPLIAGEYQDELIGKLDESKQSDLRFKQSDLRLMRDAMESERPWATAGANLIGGVATTLPALAMLPQSVAAGLLGTGTKILPKVLKTAGAGGLLGGLEGLFSGYGSGTTPEERDAQALNRGMWGAGAGAVLPLSFGLGIKAVKGGFDWILGTDISKIAKYFNISENAATLIKNTMPDDGDITQSVRALKKAGDDGMIGDANEAAQVLLDAASTESPQASKIIGDAVQERASKSRSGLETSLNETMGQPVVGVRAAVRDIADKSKIPRSEAYTEAYGTPINYFEPKGQAILDVLKRLPDKVLNDAIERANNAMRMAGTPLNKHIKATIGVDGGVVFTELPNVQQLDQLKKTLQEIAYDNVDTFGRLKGDGILYNNVARDLKETVGDSVPQYKDAVKLGGDKLAEERAFTMGKDLLRPRTTVEDVIDTFGKTASDAEKEAGRKGLRLHFEEVLNRVKAISSGIDVDDNSLREVAQAVKDLSSKEARTKIRLILGNQADKFIRQIEEASKTASLAASQATNSKTAQRLSIADSVKALTEKKKLSGLNARELVDQVFGDIGDGSDEQKRVIFKEIAKVLTESKGKTAEAALIYVNNAAKGGRISAPQRELIAQALALVGYTSVPQFTESLSQPDTP